MSDDTAERMTENQAEEIIAASEIGMFRGSPSELATAKLVLKARDQRASQHDEAERKAWEVLQLNVDKPPCDCCQKEGQFWQQRCSCMNQDDLADAESWCTRMNYVARLAALLRVKDAEIERERDEWDATDNARLAEIAQLKSELVEWKPEISGEASGCVPCFTCGGYKPPLKACAFCAGSRAELAALRSRLAELADLYWHDCRKEGERGANHCAFGGTKVCTVCQLADAQAQLRTARVEALKEAADVAVEPTDPNYHALWMHGFDAGVQAKTDAIAALITKETA